MLRCRYQLYGNILTKVESVGLVQTSLLEVWSVDIINKWNLGLLQTSFIFLLVFIVSLSWFCYGLHIEVVSVLYHIFMFLVLSNYVQLREHCSWLRAAGILVTMQASVVLTGSRFTLNGFVRKLVTCLSLIMFVSWTCGV